MCRRDFPRRASRSWGTPSYRLIMVQVLWYTKFSGIHGEVDFVRKSNRSMTYESISNGGSQMARPNGPVKPITKRVRDQVLQRDGFTCQMCGAVAGDLDDLNPSLRVRLHIGRIRDRSHGGTDEAAELRTLCSTCFEGAKNIVQEPPSQTWLLAQVRRASTADQRATLEWLKKKFGDDEPSAGNASNSW